MYTLSKHRYSIKEGTEKDFFFLSNCYKKFPVIEKVLLPAVMHFSLLSRMVLEGLGFSHSF